MKRLLFLLLCLPAVLAAQDNSRYRPGAVAVVDGKVVFSREIAAPGLTQEQVYDIALAWAQNQFNGTSLEKNRVLYSNRKAGDIACMGEQFLTFAHKALSLDRATINYQMQITCINGKCIARIMSIRYLYNVVDKMETLRAEEMITDEHAFNKKQTKMLSNTGKFRKHTIDLADQLFGELAAAIGKATTPAQAVAVQVTTPQAPVSSPAVGPAANMTGEEAPAPADLAGYKQISPERIPGNIIKQLSENWMLITAGQEARFNPMTASWGGLGYMFDKPVAFCFVNPQHYTYGLMQEGDTYTLTFYTETYREVLQYCGSHSGKDVDKVKETGLTPVTTPRGSKAFAEAWMVIECRKLIAQPLGTASIALPALKAQWEGKQMPEMFIGEILNVWVK